MPAPEYALTGLTVEQINDLIFAITNAPMPLVRSSPLLQNFEGQIQAQTDAYNASLQQPTPEPLPTLPESIAPPAPVSPE
jgi:hypothetical protein